MYPIQRGGQEFCSGNIYSLKAESRAPGYYGSNGKEAKYLDSLAKAANISILRGDLENGEMGFYINGRAVLAEKLRATDNVDEILLAATDWVNKGLNHPRKDKIVDFSRGKVLLRIGRNDYQADVVVGTRKNGEMVLYDVLNLKNTAFKKKETDAAISTNPSPGAARSTASVSNSNMPPSAGNSNTENSGKRSAYEDTEEQMAKL